MQRRSAVALTTATFAGLIAVSILTRVGNAGATVDDQQPDENGQNAAGPNDVQAEIAPQIAGSGDDLGTCRWERVQGSSSAGAVAACGTNQRIIGGGCYSSGAFEIQYNWLYEGLGFPDPNELWYNTSGGTGMACGFTGAGNHYALALCCGS